ncbi:MULTISPECIES: AlbA family DNA-binding domain-containing protein [Hansschlegelia]|uniref:ATP-binding protein n=1 Tax=Hansschlegelia zhihuaiae TaxID=405005 RepID=A0A4Q0MDN6_9HYPH|nr:ATP-binding protein [Hansschlegelia zhihuaiae]RXF71517.1 ATP-binding protein [Hansschlegelia zhihuaiae]
MTVLALETTPIEELTADDVRDFVAGRNVAESQTLEFKQEASSFARRRSIAALANAYGGTFVIGVVEEAHVAVALQLVPDCVEEANRLGQSVADAFTPPLVGLRIRGVPVEGDAGVVIARVPASPRRPHATSRQGEKDGLFVFVRRGLETRAVGMREVQDMTLAASSQAERVFARIAALRSPVQESRLSEPLQRRRPPFQIHLCAAPVTPVSLGRLDADRTLQAGEINFEGPFGPVVFRHLNGDWRPIYRGLQMKSSRKDLECISTLHADGACEIHFRASPLTIVRHDAGEDVSFYLNWLVGLQAARILWCEKIRAAVAEPQLEFALGDFLACDYERVTLNAGQRYEGDIGAMSVGAQAPDPGLFGDAGDVDRLLNAAVRDFYNLGGQAGPTEDVVFDLAPARRAWGL